MFLNVCRLPDVMYLEMLSIINNSNTSNNK